MELILMKKMNIIRLLFIYLLRIVILMFLDYIINQKLIKMPKTMMEKCCWESQVIRML